MEGKGQGEERQETRDKEGSGRKGKGGRDRRPERRLSTRDRQKTRDNRQREESQETNNKEEEEETNKMDKKKEKKRGSGEAGNSWWHVTMHHDVSHKES